MSDWPTLAASPDEAVRNAFALLEKGDTVGALAITARAAPDAADPAGMVVVKALSLRRRGQQRIAVKALEAALADYPARGDLWVALGLCRRDMGAPKDAQAAYEKARAADPDYAYALYHLAVVTQEMGDAAAAVPLYQAFNDTPAGEGHWLSRSLLGSALRSVGRFDEAIAATEQAIERNPEDIPTRNSMVMALYEFGDETAAVEAGRTVLEMKDALAMRRFQEMAPDLKLTERQVAFDPAAPARNIIAFSLWGDDPVYTHGAIVNAQLAPHVYPSWRCRFYCDASVPGPIVRELRRLGADVKMVDDPELQTLKPLWRFLASDDPDIDRFICRDADSRLNVQEAVAVDAWLKSGMPFHIMRDHPFHMEVILAGMWGGIARVLPSIQAHAKLAAGYAANRWNDQEFLRDIVWPLVRNRACVHDSVYAFRGAGDFPPQCRLHGKVHVGGAVKAMPPWPDPAWTAAKNG